MLKIMIELTTYVFSSTLSAVLTAGAISIYCAHAFTIITAALTFIASTFFVFITSAAEVERTLS